MITNADLNLNKYMQDLNSPAANRTRRLSGASFDAQYEVQTRNLIASRLQIKDMIKISNVGTAIGTITNGDDVLISAQLIPDNQSHNNKNLGVPEISVYGTTSAVGSMQIFPRAGAGISFGAFSFYSGFDYTSATDENSVFMLVIENNSGANKPVYIEGRFKYIMEDDGESTFS